MGKSVCLLGASALLSTPFGQFSTAVAANPSRPVAMNSAQTSTLPPANPPATPSNEESLFVRFHAASTEVERLDVITNQYNGQLVRWLPQIDTAIVRVASVTARRLLQSTPSGNSSSTSEAPEGDSTSQTEPSDDNTAASRHVLHIEADGLVQGCEDEPPRTSTIPPSEVSDPELAHAHGLTQIRAPESWPSATGRGCTIAIIDTGIDLNHPEFAGRISENGANFVAGDVGNEEPPQDDNGHGTHVAGIIGAARNNGQGAAGVAPDCELLPIKVLDTNNLGTWSDVASGILYAVTQGADIINLSLGATTSPPDAVRQAIEIAVENAVVVAAAGNAATDLRFYPASYDGVVAVGALNQDKRRWPPSNYGPWITISAPGEGIYSTALGSGYEQRSGTSMAAGFISGTCALVHESGIQNPAAIIHRLVETADPITGGDSTNRQLGAGQVDALGAVVGEDKIFLPLVSS